MTDAEFEVAYADARKLHTDKALIRLGVEHLTQQRKNKDASAAARAVTARIVAWYEEQVAAGKAPAL